MTNWIPDPAALARPAYLSLAEQFARAIERGALPAGARLVPHRKLADALGLSVQTVSRAYDELIRRGLITGEVGRGSFVLGPGAEARQPYLPERPGEVIDLSILKPVVEAMHLDRLREGFLWLGENLAASSAMSALTSFTSCRISSRLDPANGLFQPSADSDLGFGAVSLRSGESVPAGLLDRSPNRRRARKPWRRRRNIGIATPPPCAGRGAGRRVP